MNSSRLFCSYTKDITKNLGLVFTKGENILLFLFLYSNIEKSPFGLESQCFGLSTQVEDVLSLESPLYFLESLYRGLLCYMRCR